MPPRHAIDGMDRGRPPAVPNLDSFPIVEHPGVGKFNKLPLLTERTGV